MSLTKATYSMVSGAIINVFDYMSDAQRQSVIAGDMVEDVTVPCQTALTAAKSQRQVFFPTGKYKTTAALTAYGGFYGTGAGTVFMPQGNHECFSFLPGTNNESWAITSSMSTYVGDFMIQFPGSTDTAGNSAQKGIWINKGITLPSNGSCENVSFQNIYFRNCYNALYQGFADKGNLWNCSFRDIMIVSSKDYGVYFDLTGSNGSLNVSFDNITVDYGVAPSYGKGAYLNAIANLTFKGISASRLTSDGAVMYIANCTNVDITVQQENNLMNVIDQRPTMILNCNSIEMALVVNTPIVNPGSGNNVNYIYVDDQTKSFILRQFQTVGETITSGTRKVLNAAFGTGSSTKFTILDGTVTSADVVMSSGQLSATYFPATNYALQNTPIARRTAAQGIATVAGVAKDLQSVAKYAGKTGQVAGLYLVQGVRTSNFNIGFTDLVLVTGVGTAVAQTAVAVSTNTIAGADARTYGIAGGFLQVTIPTNDYIVGITGFDLAGAIS